MRFLRAGAITRPREAEAEARPGASSALPRLPHAASQPRAGWALLPLSRLI